MITFGVDDVVPATEPLPTQPLHETFPEALAIGGDPALAVLRPDGVHPLLDAVGRAFAEHRPLVLSPDAVWLTIAQGVAQHIRLHAEELRPQLVSHPGRKRLEVVLAGTMPEDAEDWCDLVATFDKLLAAEVRDTDLFACDFSTSTDVERTAGRIVALDAYSSYFSLWLVFVCGIPSVTLTGTVEDWRKIRARVDAIAGFGLQRWCRSLAPIADQFVLAAQGTADIAFWQRIYSPADAYGGDVITGWVARLYPYLGRHGAQDGPNPLLDLPIGEPRDLTVAVGKMGYNGPGIRSDAVPATLSRLIVNINDQVGGDNRAVALHAGLVGIAQDADGALRPVAGWHLTPAAVEIDDVIEWIRRDHDTDPPQPQPMPLLMNAAGDLLALYAAIGSATLFGGAWRLLPATEHRSVWRGAGRRTIETFIDLADGRSIGTAVDYGTQTEHLVICRLEPVDADLDDPKYRLVDDPADVPVLGTSLAFLLNAALDADGDIAHLETGRLADLER